MTFVGLRRQDIATTASAALGAHGAGKGPVRITPMPRLRLPGLLRPEVPAGDLVTTRPRPRPVPARAIGERRGFIRGCYRVRDRGTCALGRIRLS